MKTLYLECQMGAAGDMLFGALLSLVENRDEFMERFNALGLPGVTARAEPGEKCGIQGLRVTVTVDGQEEHEHREHKHAHDHAHDHAKTEHHHRGMAEIRALIQGLPLSDTVRDTVLQIYESIAHAESAVHGCPVAQIHFHEVGALDAIADITGVCMLMEQLSPVWVVCSPVTTGFGLVDCAHGILPVPAPATAELLKGVPCRAGEIEGELCTPTGAALLQYFADVFAPMPLLKIEKIGYGLGFRDFPAANCVRVFWGTLPGENEPAVVELSCNLDDMTGEDIGYAMEILREAGALEVYWTSIGMKKNRPGIKLSLLCPLEQAGNFTRLLLTHTTTFGVRQIPMTRTTLRRTIRDVETPYGTAAVKTGVYEDIVKHKPEFDCLAAIARRENTTPAKVRDEWGLFHRQSE